MSPLCRLILCALSHFAHTKIFICLNNVPALSEGSTLTDGEAGTYMLTTSARNVSLNPQSLSYYLLFSCYLRPLLGLFPGIPRNRVFEGVVLPGCQQVVDAILNISTSSRLTTSRLNGAP